MTDDGGDITAGVPALSPPRAALAPLPDLGLGDEKDTIFAIEMARHGDMLRAVIKSGHESDGHSLDEIAERLADRPDIKKATEIAKRLASLPASAELTKDGYEDFVWRLATSAWAWNKHSEATNAVRLLGQARGYLIERKEVTHRHALQELDDATLARIAGQAIDADFVIVKPEITGGENVE